MTIAAAALADNANAYARARKSEKGAILDSLAERTGWSREHCRRLLREMRAKVDTAAEPRTIGRPAGSRKYADAAIRALESAWRLAGRPSGLHLAAMMPTLLPRLEATGRLDLSGQDRISLLAMSPATIDRYLRPARAADTAPRWEDVLPQRPLSARTAMNRMDGGPGRCALHIVSHCARDGHGPHLTTFLIEDELTGWRIDLTVEGTRAKHLYPALREAPVPVRELVVRSGFAHVDFSLIAWAAEHGITISPAKLTARPPKRHPSASDCTCTVPASDRPSTECRLLNTAWATLDARHNTLVPITRAKYDLRTDSGKVRVYDEPTTPTERAIATGGLATEQSTQLREAAAAVDPTAATGLLDEIVAQLRALERRESVVALHG